MCCIRSAPHQTPQERDQELLACTMTIWCESNRSALGRVDSGRCVLFARPRLYREGNTLPSDWIRRSWAISFPCRAVKITAERIIRPRPLQTADIPLLNVIRRRGSRAPDPPILHRGGTTVSSPSSAQSDIPLVSTTGAPTQKPKVRFHRRVPNLGPDPNLKQKKETISGTNCEAVHAGA